MAALLTVLSFLFAGIVRVNAAGPQWITDERRLFHALVDKYEPFVRPITNPNSTITVRYRLSLHSINELDMRAAVLSTTVWITIMWDDVMLRWDPKDYGGIDSIRLPTKRIWTPDIHPYNSRNTGIVTALDTLAVVSNDGTVLYMPPTNMMSHCSVDLTYFPYDTQMCHIKIGSWTYDGSKVDIQFFIGLDKFDLSDFVGNSEWRVIEAPAVRTNNKYDCCDAPYPDLTFSLKLRRLSTYYSYVFISPAVAVSLLIPFMFLLPASSRQKIQLGTPLMISLLLLLWMIMSVLPNFGELRPPMFVMYLVANLILVCVSIAINVFLENVYYDSQNKHPPELIRKVFLTVLGRVVCVSSTSSYNRMSSGPISMSGVQSQVQESFNSEPIGGSSSSSDRAGLCVEHVASAFEWPLICTVLDRLLFLVFLVLFILMCCVFLL